MIPVQFDYKSPDDLETAVKLLQENHNSQILGGGYQVIAKMMQGELTPSLLVDLQNIPNLKGMKTTPQGGISIGSRTTYSEIARASEIRASYSALAEAVSSIGDPQIRNWETLADVLAYQHLAPDLLAVALVLEATLNIFDTEGNSILSTAEFIQRTQAEGWQPRGIITAINFPAPISNSGSAYEVTKHPASKYTICGVAAFVQSSSENQCRVAVTGATSMPLRLLELEAELTGKALTFDNIAIATQRGRKSVELLENNEGKSVLNSDNYASAAYRGHLIEVLAQRAIRQAAEKAGLKF